jgi:hypothetical protein
VSETEYPAGLKCKYCHDVVPAEEMDAHRGVCRAAPLNLLAYLSHQQREANALAQRVTRLEEAAKRKKRPWWKLIGK